MSRPSTEPDARMLLQCELDITRSHDRIQETIMSWGLELSRWMLCACQCMAQITNYVTSTINCTLAPLVLFTLPQCASFNFSGRLSLLPVWCCLDVEDCGIRSDIDWIWLNYMSHWSWIKSTCAHNHLLDFAGKTVTLFSLITSLLGCRRQCLLAQVCASQISQPDCHSWLLHVARKSLVHRTNFLSHWFHLTITDMK